MLLGRFRLPVFEKSKMDVKNLLHQRVVAIVVQELVLGTEDDRLHGQKDSLETLAEATRKPLSPVDK